MVTPLSTTSLSLFTPSTLATQGANVSSTTASSTITDHAFLGYVSVSFVDTTTIYSSADCAPSSTLTASGNWGACCSGSCPLYTGCVNMTLLKGAYSVVETCTGISTCRTDNIYQSAYDWEIPTSMIYCAENSDYIGASYYRAFPTLGILNTNTSGIANATAQLKKQGPSFLGIGLGSGLGVIILVIIGLVVCCLCTAAMRPGGYDTPADRAERRREKCAKQQEQNDARARRAAENEEHNQRIREELSAN